MFSTLNSLFIAAVLAGTPLLLGALGEILTEKSGNLNQSGALLYALVACFMILVSRYLI